MKALVKAKPEPGLWMEDLPEPSVGPNDVLIQVRKTSICGTDLHIDAWDEWAQRTIPVPMAVGHEFMGTVAAIGDEVDGLSVGRRVSAEGHIVCGRCRNCQAGNRHLCIRTVGLGVNRPGAFAEYVSVPGENVQPLPDDVSDDIGCILDPLGNATHTSLSFDVVGEDVLITGAGPIGMMATAICRHVGARHIVVTDLNDFRLGIATEMGATRVVNPSNEDLNETMRELGMKEGFDVGLEMSGVGVALLDMITTMNNGGKIALLGIPASDVSPIRWNDIVFKGLTLQGIYGRRMFETWYKMLAMLQTGLDVAPVITHHFSAADFREAFAVARAGEAGKVVIDWT